MNIHQIVEFKLENIRKEISTFEGWKLLAFKDMGNPNVLWLKIDITTYVEQW